MFVKKIFVSLSVCFHQHLASKDWLVPVLRPSQITNTASFVSSSDLLKGAVTNIDAQRWGPFFDIDMIPEFLFHQLPDGDVALMTFSFIFETGILQQFCGTTSSLTRRNSLIRAGISRTEKL